MAKVTPQVLDQELNEVYDIEWDWEMYLHDAICQSDWTDWDEHPWAWYMERDIRTREGWTLITVSRDHKDVTVIYYLKSLDAKFKHSKNEFLIQDQQHAIMVALKYA